MREGSLIMVVMGMTLLGVSVVTLLQLTPWWLYFLDGLFAIGMGIVLNRDTLNKTKKEGK
jgi:hypothetical protein